MRANDPREPSPFWPLEPTQIAPESRTIGRSAEAKPPANGSSGFARATRFDTTRTFTGTPPGGPLTRMTEICSGFVMRRTQAPEIAGFVMGIAASAHRGWCGAIKHDPEKWMPVFG
jgi:hypothetical protein